MTTFTVRQFEYLLCARNYVGTIDVAVNEQEWCLPGKGTSSNRQLHKYPFRYDCDKDYGEKMMVMVMTTTTHTVWKVIQKGTVHFISKRCRKRFGKGDMEPKI